MMQMHFYFEGYASELWLKRPSLCRNGQVFCRIAAVVDKKEMTFCKMIGEGMNFKGCANFVSTERTDTW